MILNDIFSDSSASQGFINTIKTKYNSYVTTNFLDDIEATLIYNYLVTYCDNLLWCEVSYHNLQEGKVQIDRYLTSLAYSLVIEVRATFQAQKEELGRIYTNYQQGNIMDNEGPIEKNPTTGLHSTYEKGEVLQAQGNFVTKNTKALNKWFSTLALDCQPIW